MLGCTPCYQLFVLQLYKSSFIFSLMYDIDYSNIFYLQFIMFYLLFTVYHVVIYVHTIYTHEHLPLYTHTLIRPLSYGPRFARTDIGRFLILFRRSCDRTLHEESTVSLTLFLVFLPPFYSYFCILLDSYLSHSVFISVLYLYDIMCGCLYVILQ